MIPLSTAFSNPKNFRFPFSAKDSLIWGVKCEKLRNGPDKNDSNNGNEHVGMQKGAKFSIVCTYF